MTGQIKQNSLAREKRIGTALMLLSTLLWGSSYVVTKGAVTDIPAMLLVAIRNLLGGVAVALLLWKQTRLMRREVILCGGIIGILYGAGMILQTYGIQYSTPGKSAFLTAAYCVMMPFLEWVFLKARPKGKNFLAAAVGMLGIGLVALNERFTIEIGDLYTLLGSVCFAFQIVLLSVFLKKHDAIPLNIALLLSAGVFQLLLALLFEKPPAQIPASAAWSVLYLAIACTGVPMLLQGFAQERLRPTVITIILGFEAVFSVIFSAIFYGEAFTPRCLVGFLLIFLAVLISELSFGRKTVPKGE